MPDEPSSSVEKVQNSQITVKLHHKAKSNWTRKLTVSRGSTQIIYYTTMSRSRRRAIKSEWVLTLVNAKNTQSFIYNEIAQFIRADWNCYWRQVLSSIYASLILAFKFLWQSQMRVYVA